MATRYLAVESFQEWARNDITSDTNIIEEAIQTSEEWIDEQANRSLVVVDAETVASARSFRVRPRTDTLRIPDLAEITAVTEGDAALVEDDDYQAEPFDNLDPHTSAYRPYDRLVRVSGYWQRNGAQPTIVVTGKWGWAEIPASVVTACRILTNDWLMNRDVRLGVVGSTADGFSIGVRQNPYVMSAIETIRGPRRWGIA